MTGLVPYTAFKGQDGIAPVAVAIEATPYVWLKQLVILAILAGYSSVIMVMLLGQSRVFYSMAKDGLLPKTFSDVHPTFQTPYKSNLIVMLFVCLFAAFIPARVVGEMTSIGTLFAFVLVCIGVIVLRYTRPELPRAFRTPFVPVVPALGVAVCVFMMVFLPLDTWIRLIVWMALGFVVYFGYSAKRSRLNKGKQ